MIRQAAAPASFGGYVPVAPRLRCLEACESRKLFICIIFVLIRTSHLVSRAQTTNSASGLPFRDHGARSSRPAPEGQSARPASPLAPPISDLLPVALQADKAAQSAGSGFSLFGGRAEKYENAAELYNQAANAFRMQKDGRSAGQCFEKAAALQTSKLNEPDDAANTLTEAFKSYRKDAPEEAARCLEQAIGHYTMKGNFRRAATHKQNLAELYEVEIGDQKRAAEAYETAAGWYENDNAEA